MMFDVVKELIVGKFTVPAEEVTASVTLEDLGLDSLDMVEFAELASERFGVEITDDEVVELNRIDRIVAVLKDRQAS